MDERVGPVESAEKGSATAANTCRTRPRSLAVAKAWSEGVLEVSTMSKPPPVISRAMALAWAMSPSALNCRIVTVSPSRQPFSASPSSIPVTASSSTAVLTCLSTATAGRLRRVPARSVASRSAEPPARSSAVGSERRRKVASGDGGDDMGRASAIGGGQGAGGVVVELVGPPEPVEPVGDRLGRQPPLGGGFDVDCDPAAMHQQ